MGDRHNVGIVQYPYGAERAKEIIWLYSHSGFWSDVPGVEGYAACVALALDEARPRWDDYSYFTRIIIHSLGESVRGISIGKCTLDEHKRYVLDPKAGKVYLMDNWKWDGDFRNWVKPIVSWTFDEFVAKYRKHDRTVRNEY